MSKGKVLIAAPVHEVLTNGLIELGYQLIVEEKINQERAKEIIAGCAGVVTSTRLQLDKELLELAKELKWIGRMGSGMEVIDLEYAASKGITCFGSPQGNANAVAEHALGMLLSLTKKISWSNNQLRRGIWLRDENRGTELEGKTVAIIGYGHTGQAFAKKLRGFDVNLIAYDKYAPGNIIGEVRRCNGLEEIHTEADILSFHVPLQEDTIHYFDQSFLSKMKKPFILLNTSRGQVVDARILTKGLSESKLLGCCLDVFEEEPFEKMGTEIKEILISLANHEHAVVTPHIAGYSREALYKMSRLLLERIVTVS
jgi:D-3-phosphoglycerate dehydrogenase / 2-oxoglutarate reductase